VARVPASQEGGQAARRPGRLLLRGDHERLRRDAVVPQTDRRRRSMGDRRLRPRAAAQPGRSPGRCPQSAREAETARDEGQAAMSMPAYDREVPWQPLQRGALIVGAVGLAVWAGGWLLAIVLGDPDLHMKVFIS